MTELQFKMPSLDGQDKKPKSKKSYAEWLSLNGVLSKEIYDRAIRDIETDYSKGRAEHGANAERLFSLGLSSGGYSDYLSGKAYELRQKGKSDAAYQYFQNEKANRLGYSDYLEKYGEAQSKLYSEVGNAIISKKITGYDDAYGYAVNRGLSENLAKEVAEVATKLAISNAKAEITKLIINNKLSDNEAKEYALLLGLSEKDAEEIFKFASSYTNILPESGQGYVDYIKNLTKGNTEK